MLTSLTCGVAGLENFQTSLDVIGNNIANSNTVGYKSGRVNFADALSQTLQAPTVASATSSGTAPVQLGSGVQTVAVENEFTQGAINPTGVDGDLAISGEGFFVVKDPSTQALYATRAGQFHTDTSGRLVTDRGMVVQGFNDIGLSNVGDITIDSNGATDASGAALTVKSYKIDAQGQINETLSDNSVLVRGQVLLTSFQNPQALVKNGDSLYSGFDMAGQLGGPGSSPAAPGTKGLGSIQSQALEMSNVDLTSEFADMITSQRAFQANARVITTSDEMLQEVVNIKH